MMALIAAPATAPLAKPPNPGIGGIEKLFELKLSKGSLLEPGYSVCFLVDFK